MKWMSKKPKQTPPATPPAVIETWHPGSSDETFRALVRQSVTDHTDEIDTALHSWAGKLEGKAVRSYYASAATSLHGTIWHHGALYHLAVAGLPEDLLERADMTEAEREKAYHKANFFNHQGYTVIAIGHAELSAIPATLSTLPHHERILFDGIVVVGK